MEAKEVLLSVFTASLLFFIFGGLAFSSFFNCLLTLASESGFLASETPGCQLIVMFLFGFNFSFLVLRLDIWLI